MPVRSRLKLLAGVAALLGLCIAGSGCHPNFVQPDGGLPVSVAAYAVPVNGPGPELVQMQYAPIVSTTVVAQSGAPQPTGPATAGPPVVRMGRPQKRGIFSPKPPAQGLAHHPQGVATQPGLGATSPAAIALRPVPTQPGALPARHLAAGPGVWEPAHRVVRDGAGSPVSTGTPPPVNTTEGPLPMPRGVPIVAAPPAEKKPPEKELGKPRPVFGKTDPKAGTGYPDLPAPGITKPLHAPREGEKRALSAYIVEPPDVLSIELSRALNDRDLPIGGPHLVRPDGTVGLGAIGSVFVAGMTLADAKQAIAEAIYNRRRQGDERTPRKKDEKKEDEADRPPPPTLKDFLDGLKVDVQAYNSKYFYVITDGGGYGEQVVRIPCTGNETVLDAIAQIQGLPAVSSKKKIWLARCSNPGQAPNILPVDYKAVAMAGSATTNYQIFPGDRLYVHSDPLIRTNSILEKVLNPVDRVFGTLLLFTSVRNGFRGTGNGFGNTGF